VQVALAALYLGDPEARTVLERCVQLAARLGMSPGLKEELHLQRPRERVDCQRAIDLPQRLLCRWVFASGCALRNLSSFLSRVQTVSGNEGCDLKDGRRRKSTPSDSRAH